MIHLLFSLAMASTVLAQTQPVPPVNSTMPGGIWEYAIQQGILGVICLALGAYHLYKDKEWSKREAALLLQIEAERKQTSEMLKDTTAKNVMGQQQMIDLSRSLQQVLAEEQRARETIYKIGSAIENLEKSMADLQRGKG